MKKAAYPPLCFILIFNLVFPGFLFAKERLAVMNLKAKHGIKKELAETISVEVRRQIHDLGIYEVVSSEDIEELAARAATTQKLGCSDNQCLLIFGSQLDSKFMIAGTLAKLKDNYHFGLRLLDTTGKDAGVKARVSRDCACTQDELPKIARVLAVQLIDNYYRGYVRTTEASPELVKQNMARLTELDKRLEKVKEDNIIEADRGFLWRYKWWLLGGVVILAGGAAASGGDGGGDSSATDTSSQPAEQSGGEITFGW
jgi:hypothetical protein